MCISVLFITKNLYNIFITNDDDSFFDPRSPFLFFGQTIFIVSTFLYLKNLLQEIIQAKTVFVYSTKIFEKMCNISRLRFLIGYRR